MLNRSNYPITTLVEFQSFQSFPLELLMTVVQNSFQMDVL